MDLNDLRIAVMIVSFALFLGILAWAWSARRRKSFDEAARYPFLDEQRGAEPNGDKR
ncbi:MAG: cbb3-type cytochrome c oxidase subunit 3 [Proteobacteria bacterium]|nr:cbb3-type cytochrome c oxidase subunit 3 [Pseudomonadota bacterium]